MLTPERLRQIEEAVCNGRPVTAGDILALVAEVRRLGARPENDLSRPAYDREAWRAARGV